MRFLLVMRLDGDWADTVLELPGGRWANELTGDVVVHGVVHLADVLVRFPVALLSHRDPAPPEEAAR